MYERYAELRDARKLNDSAVADALGITKSTFTGWKNGTLHPNTDKLYKIAKFFGTTIEYLYAGKDTDYKDEYLTKYSCSAADFKLMKQIKENKELWQLMKLEQNMPPKKLKALQQVIKALDHAAS